MPPLQDGVALLVPLLRARLPLLLAGAGASAEMGYPLWDDLVRRLAAEFAPELTLSDDNLSDVDRIASVAADAGRADEYFKWMCCNFPKAARERWVELAGLRLMPPPRTSY